MDRGTPPWRALEEPSAADRSAEPHAGHGAPGREPGPPDGRPRPRQWVMVAVGVAAAVVLAAVALVVARTEPTQLTLAGIETGGTPVSSPAADTAARPATIAVDVGGAVQRPGVYRVAAGSRVADAIAAAGGYSPRVDVAAASDRLNLAAVLADGERVRVPARGESTAPAPGTEGAAGSPAAPAAGPAGALDLNRATAAELEALPGIGPVTAAKIIAARESEPFVTVDDLRARALVGPATFAKIRALVAVNR